MPQLRKMYSTAGKPMPHVGKMLEQVLTEKRLTKAWLCRQLQVNGGAAKQYIRQQSLHAALLWKIGQLLDFDFFAALSAEFPKKKEALPENKNQELQQQFAELKKENELFRSLLTAKLNQ